MTPDNQSLPPLPKARSINHGIEFVSSEDCSEYGDARAAHARKVALEEAQEACKQADLLYDKKGERLTLTYAHHIIGALK